MSMCFYRLMSTNMSQRLMANSTVLSQYKNEWLEKWMPRTVYNTYYTGSLPNYMYIISQYAHTYSTCIKTSGEKH